MASDEIEEDWTSIGGETMAPDPMEHWMKRNLDWLKEFNLEDVLFLPGSHNAGMSINTSQGKLGSEANTITQSHSILDQLKYGVRWFDIRPTWKIPGPDSQPGDSGWYCGHFSHTAAGWQGATGQRLVDVIAQVNEFLRDHKELVVLRITHVMSADLGVPLSRAYHEDLLQVLFEGLEKVYKQTIDGERVCEAVNLQKLDKYIADDGKVIVTSRSGDGAGINDDAWEACALVRTDLNTPLVGCGASQSDFQATLSSLWPFAGKEGTKNVRDVAQRYQRRELACKPQELYGQEKCGPVSMDDIKDDRLFNICLAASRARHYARVNGRGYTSPVICYYGGQQITDMDVLNSIQGKIESHGLYTVSKERMKTDPPGHGDKSCCVFYMETKESDDELFGRGRFAFEGGELDFRIDFERMEWGDTAVTGRAFGMAYWNLFRAVMLGQYLTPTLETVAEFDPRYGQGKDLVIWYRSATGHEIKQRRLRENEPCFLGLDILRITYDGHTVPRAETYEPFFWRLERGGELRIDNRLMGGGKEWDPTPGKGKMAKVECRLYGEGVDRSWTMQRAEYWTLNIPKVEYEHPRDREFRMAAMSILS